MTDFLSVDSVRMAYGTFEVLKGVSLNVGQEETFAIIGPNGAGKTSLFKALTGEVDCTSGKIIFDGRDVTDLPSYERARLGMGRTFQVARVFFDYTVLENIIVAIETREAGAGRPVGAFYAWRTSKAVRDEAVATLEEFALHDKAAVESKFLSHGDKKRLELALTIAQRPRILMLDEPTAGMAPSERVAVVELIGRLCRERRIAVVMTEHDMDVIFGLAKRLMVLNYGEVIAVGSVEEVRQNSLVQEIYLGKQIYYA